MNVSGLTYDALVWGDGTLLDPSIFAESRNEPLKNNPNAPTMGLWGGRIDDFTANDKGGCLCQNV